MDTTIRKTKEVANEEAELVLLPEAALTGLINNDDPTHDLPLGQLIPGQVTEQLGKLCSQGNIWLSIGLLERDNKKLYDSAILITPHGDIGLLNRRNHLDWQRRRYRLKQKILQRQSHHRWLA